MAQRAWRMAQRARGTALEPKMGGVTMAKFRFQDLEIWQMAIELGDKLFDIADELERRRLYRFAEQVRSAGMSMSNNIAEGSGCPSDKEFARFLDIARRSTFENANIVIILARRKLLDEKTQNALLEAFDHLSRKITNFKPTLKIA
jgi:four helix bundle protein